jgi:hypothetical protein
LICLAITQLRGFNTTVSMVLEALRPQSSQYTPNATRDAWTVLLSGEAENQIVWLEK